METFIKVAPPIFAAFISGLFILRVHSQNRLKEKLLAAYRDIEFLQAVEQAHVVMTTERSGKSNQRYVRKLVRDKHRLVFSGMSPNTVRYQIKRMESASSFL